MAKNQDTLIAEIKTAPTIESIEACTKVSLMELAKHFNVVGVKAALKKASIKKLLVRKSVEDQILSEEDLDELEPDPRDIQLTLELRKLELAAEVEKREKELAAEAEQNEREREARAKALQKEFEFKEQELASQEKIALAKLQIESQRPPAPPKDFNVTKQVRLVPPFQEKEVDKYFSHFEKVA